MSEVANTRMFFMSPLPHTFSQALSERYEPHHSQVWDSASATHLTLDQAVQRMNGMDGDLQKIAAALRAKSLMNESETALGAVLRLISRPSGWVSGEPPKDGKIYLGIGCIACYAPDGGESIPFLSHVRWCESEGFIGWLDGEGMAIRSFCEDQVHIHHWSELPTATAAPP